MIHFLRHWPLFFLAMMLVPTACTNNDDDAEPQVLRGERIYGITTTNELVLFGAGNPNFIAARRSLSGLPTGEIVRGMDFNSPDNVLYILTSANRIYTLDTTTATVNPVGAGFAAVMGTEFGFDFNPTVQRVRIHANQGGNRRVDNGTGLQTNDDGPLMFDAATTGNPPASAACAYTNATRGSRPVAGNTRLFAIDAARDVLMEVNVATSVCTVLGPLGFDAASNVSYDIVARTNTGYTSWVNAGETNSRLYTTIREAGTTPRAVRIGDLPVTLVALAVPIL